MTVTQDEPITSLGQLLDHQAALRPQAPALYAPGSGELSYHGLRRRVAEVGRELGGLGVGRGHRVAIVLPNGADLALVFLAVAVHACAAPLNPAYRESEFAFYLDDMAADALLVEEGSESPAIAVAKERGIRVIELVPQPGPAGTFTLHGGTEAPPPQLTGPARPEETALILHTSGTTSQPKLVPLTHANLCVAARNTCAAFAITEGDRCLNVMPLFHAHGLTSTLLATLVGGGAIVCTPGFSDTRFFDWLTEFLPTWYTAVPTMHQALLAVAGEHAEALARADLRFIRSASAPLPGPVLNALEDTFRAPVIEAYGMTESGSLIASNPLPPGARKPGSVGLPVGGPVAILDKDGRRLGPGDVGEIAIRGENVMSGYEHNPEANRLAFTDSWLRTGDEGRLDEDGYLHVIGRTKEIINRGGSKVSPVEIDDVLSGHPAVKTAVAFGLPHSSLGEDVAVAVITRPDAVVTEREIREFVAERLADFKVPSRVFMVADVPRSPTGKVQRLKLAELLSAPAREPAREPRGPLERRIAALWADVLGHDRIGLDDNFFDLGGNSLLLSRVSARLEEELGTSLPVVVLTMYPTISSLAAHLSGSDNGKQTPAAGADGTERLGRGKERLLRQRGLRKRTTTKESN